MPRWLFTADSSSRRLRKRGEANEWPLTRCRIDAFSRQKRIFLKRKKYFLHNMPLPAGWWCPAGHPHHAHTTRPALPAYLHVLLLIPALVGIIYRIRDRQANGHVQGKISPHEAKISEIARSKTSADSHSAARRSNHGHFFFTIKSLFGSCFVLPSAGITTTVTHTRVT